MVNISEILDIGELTNLIVEGHINVTHHPSLPLRIYNYSKTASYAFRGKENWPNAAIQCRGLIVDDDDLIVSRPFPKFFGMQEHSRSDIVFSKPFSVTDKMDGSLGIAYRAPDNSVRIATRGSFTSDQAIHATETLQSKYRLFTPKPGYTWLFEIIYPSNRIVVDYGKTDDLVLLAVIDNTTGLDIPINKFQLGCGPAVWDGPIVKQYYSVDCKPRELLEKLGVNDGATEGFVLKFDWPKDSTTRVKVKYDEYMRLHKIVTGVSNKTVWEHLSGGLSFDELMDRVPDEFNAWLKETIVDLRDQFDVIFRKAHEEYALVEISMLQYGHEDRKSFAEFAKKMKYTDLIFMLLDGSTTKLEEKIWKMIRPHYAKPFSKDIDNQEGIIICGQLKLDHPSLTTLMIASNVSVTTVDPGLTIRNVVIPGKQIHVIRSQDEVRIHSSMFWGWDHGALYNARIETALRPSMWSEALENSRCLIPVTMFWEKSLRCKAVSGPTMLGGIFNTHGEVAILTMRANEFVAPAHHRMPVVVQEAQWSSWLESVNYVSDIVGTDITLEEDIYVAPQHPWGHGGIGQTRGP